MRKIFATLIASSLLLGSVGMANAAGTTSQPTTHKHAVKHHAKLSKKGIKSKSHTAHKAHKKTAKVHKKPSIATQKKSNTTT